jgi:hypothetical protein
VVCLFDCAEDNVKGDPQVKNTAQSILLIAVNWTVSSYNMDVVKLLHSKGHHVDVLVTPRSRFRFTSHPAETGDLITACASFPRVYLRFWTLWRLLSILFSWLVPVDPWLRRSARARLANKRYDAVIALEKESLILAKRANIEGLTEAKVTYWSHELYTVGYPNYYRYRRLDQLTMSLLPVINGVLIQDKRRHAVLVRHAKNPGPVPFFLPITEYGPAFQGLAMNVRAKLGLPPHAKLLISHGLIGSLRGLDFLCQLGLELGQDYVIVIHGERIDSSAPKLPSNVVIFEQRFDHAALMSFLSAFDLGLTIYARNDIENDRLTAFSSHKMAIYARCGLPFLAIRNESYEDLLSRHAWGELVETVQDAANSARKLLRKKEEFQIQARLCYESTYRLETYENELERYVLDAGIAMKDGQ